MQVYGKLGELRANLRILPPDRNVRILLHMETAFEQSRVLLALETHEENAQNAKGALTSGLVEDQLQRAILFSAACLSSNKDLQEIGHQILRRIDDLEQYGLSEWCQKFDKLSNCTICYSMQAVYLQVVCLQAVACSPYLLITDRRG